MLIKGLCQEVISNMYFAVLSFLIAGALAAPTGKHCAPSVTGKTLQVESEGRTYPVGFTKLLGERNAPSLKLLNESASVPQTFSFYACGERSGQLVSDDIDYCVTLAFGGDMLGSHDGSLMMQPCMDSADVRGRQRFALDDGRITSGERSAVKVENGVVALTAGKSSDVLRLV